MENTFFIVFDNKKEEILFNNEISQIVKYMKELISDGCLLPEDALSELQYICSNRNIAELSEIILIEKIKYSIKNIINIFNLNNEQIKNLSKYILYNMNKI